MKFDAVERQPERGADGTGDADTRDAFGIDDQQSLARDVERRLDELDVCSAASV